MRSALRAMIGSNAHIFDVWCVLRYDSAMSQLFAGLRSDFGAVVGAREVARAFAALADRSVGGKVRGSAQRKEAGAGFDGFGRGLRGPLWPGIESLGSSAGRQVAPCAPQ